MKTKVFFLRGLVRESAHWAGFLEKFNARFPEYEAIAIDLPGSGKFFREISPNNIKAMKDFLRAQYIQQASGKPAHLFALSLGAMVGLQWMHDHPEDFSSSILLNTSLKGISPFFERLRPQNYFALLQIALSSSLRFRESKILEITSHNLARHAELEKEWTLIQEKRPVSLANSLRQLIAAASFSPPREKPAPKILLLSSYGDALVSSSCTKKLSEFWGIPAYFHESAGHDLTLDAPDWVLEKVEEFFSKN